jgi:IQ and AAA domain-containing protein
VRGKEFPHKLTCFISLPSAKDPVYLEEEESFDQWWAKTPLGRKKQKTLEMEMEARLENEKEGNKKKSKGK